MKAKLIVSAVQQPCDQDKQSNLDYSIQQIHAAAEAGADLVVLPELHLGPYFCQNEDFNHFSLAETIPGPTTEVLAKLAKQLSIVIVATIFEKRAPGLYHNTAVVFDQDGSMAGKYRKMHIPDDPAFYEKFYFTPSDLGYKIFKTKYATFGVLICWDQWYPEAARITSLMGAEILFYPTAIGWATAQTEEVNNEQYNGWQTIQRGHAVANGVHIVSVNRTGLEQNGAMKFWGGSFVANPFGRVLHQASHDDEETSVVELDLDKTDFYRTHWPFLRDRRIDSYQPITKRFIDEEK